MQLEDVCFLNEPIWLRIRTGGCPFDQTAPQMARRFETSARILAFKEEFCFIEIVWTYLHVGNALHTRPYSVLN
jgi:hypothetical protein